MSAQVLEVSEGLPRDGQIFEQPTQSRDNEEPRFVTIVGSFIEPVTAQERAWTKYGGLEVSNPCLRYVRNFLGKCRITPVLKDTHDGINIDVWEKATGKDASYFQRPPAVGYVAPTNEYGNPSKSTTMMFKVALPGQQIDSILNGSANVRDRARRGIVEHKSLKGLTYNPEPLRDGVTADRNIWEIQKTIFPTYPLLPILLDEIEEILEAAKVHASLRPTIDEFASSLDQFRDFARATVEQTHYTMRESAAKSDVGYIPRYTDLDFVLLEQLGMARQDREIRKDVKVSSDPDLREALNHLIQLQIEEKQANIERMKRVEEVVPAITESTMAAAPITNATPKGQEQINVAMADTEKPKKAEVACECGKYTGSGAGLSMHKRMHCERRYVPEIAALNE